MMLDVGEAGKHSLLGGGGGYCLGESLGWEGIRKTERILEIYRIYSGHIGSTLNPKLAGLVGNEGMVEWKRLSELQECKKMALLYEDII